MYKHLLESLLSVLLGVRLDRELLDHIVILCFIFRGAVFHGGYKFYISTNNAQGSHQFFYIIADTCYYLSFLLLLLLLLLLNCRNSLCIVECKLYKIGFKTTFSHSVISLSTLWIVSFDAQKFLTR